VGEQDAGHVQVEKTSDETNEKILVLIDRLIPVVKRRVLQALERSPEDVESEIAHSCKPTDNPRIRKTALDPWQSFPTPER